MLFHIQKIINENKGKSINSLILDLELNGVETYYNDNKIHCIYRGYEVIINIIKKNK